MTRDEILNMPAGREMDALIAEKVMGWTWRAFQPAHVPGELVRRPYPGNWSALPRRIADGTERLAGGWDSDLPHYSTDISAAWEVTEKITDIFSMPGVFGGSRYGRFYLYITKVRALGFSANYHQAVFKRNGGKDKKVVTSLGDTTPLAICRAALLAVMEIEK